MLDQARADKDLGRQFFARPTAFWPVRAIEPSQAQQSFDSRLLASLGGGACLGTTCWGSVECLWRGAVGPVDKAAGQRLFRSRRIRRLTQAVRLAAPTIVRFPDRACQFLNDHPLLNGQRPHRDVITQREDRR